jgi:hypothetical protein
MWTCFGYWIFVLSASGVAYRISVIELGCLPSEEILLPGLGGEEAFGENGWEMTES